jgi:hypothetical protein
VTFDPEGYRTVPPSHLSLQSRVPQPATYVLRAVASDSTLETIADFAVTVTDATR